MWIIVFPVGRCRFLEENESGLRFRRNKIWRFTECTTPYNRPSAINCKISFAKSKHGDALSGLRVGSSPLGGSFTVILFSWLPMRNVDWQVLILTFQMIMQINKCYALKFGCPPLCKLKIWLRRCNRLWKRNTTPHFCPILEIKYIVFTSGVMEFQSPKLNSEGFYLYQV